MHADGGQKLFSDVYGRRLPPMSQPLGGCGRLTSGCFGKIAAITRQLDAAAQMASNITAMQAKCVTSPNFTPTRIQQWRFALPLKRALVGVLGRVLACAFSQTCCK